MTGREIRYTELPECEGWTFPIWSYTDWDELDDVLIQLSRLTSETLDTFIDSHLGMRKTETGTVRVLIGTDLPACVPHIVEYRPEAREQYDDPLPVVALKVMESATDYTKVGEWARIRQDWRAIRERAIELGRENELKIGFQWEWF